MVSSCFSKPTLHRSSATIEQILIAHQARGWRIVGAGTKRTKTGSLCGCCICETIICRCCVSEVNSLTQRREIRLRQLHQISAFLYSATNSPKARSASVLL
jgi:hypothetical protein